VELIGAGRDADVFALGNGRVLRRYRQGGDVAPEVEMMRHVAAQGFAVPFVFEGCGADLVLERVDGPTMLASLIAGEMEPSAAGRMLADLANALHSIPALESMVPFERVIHLDLHPDNVILGEHGPILIDWRNSTDGPPCLDNALTAVIIAQAVLSGMVPGFDDAARQVLHAFLDAVDHPVGEHLGEAIAMRRNNMTMSAFEVAVLDDAPAFIASVV